MHPACPLPHPILLQLVPPVSCSRLGKFSDKGGFRQLSCTDPPGEGCKAAPAYDPGRVGSVCKMLLPTPHPHGLPWLPWPSTFHVWAPPCQCNLADTSVT